MQRIVHCLHSLILALALVLAGPGVSGPAKGAMLVELCAGGEITEIWLDGEGNPVNPGTSHVKCLDCILFSAPLPRTAVVVLAAAAVRIPLDPALWRTPDIHPAAHLRPDTRGPPLAGDDDWLPGDPRPAIRSLPPQVSWVIEQDQSSSRPRPGGLRTIPGGAQA